MKTLVVGSNLELNAEVTVSNDGEDSYGTTVTFFYPTGLSYRRVAGSQVFFLGMEEAGNQDRPVLGSVLRLVGHCLAASSGPRVLVWSWLDGYSCAVWGLPLFMPAIFDFGHFFFLGIEPRGT